MYPGSTNLQRDVLGCFALRSFTSLVLSDVTSERDQEVVTVVVCHQSWGRVTPQEIRWEGVCWSRLLVKVPLRHLNKADSRF